LNPKKPEDDIARKLFGPPVSSALPIPSKLTPTPMRLDPGLTAQWDETDKLRSIMTWWSDARFFGEPQASGEQHERRTP
jgi:hypothetical protein